MTDAEKIEALYAYDMGATDSGIKDDALKIEMKDWPNERLYPALTECVRVFTEAPYGYESIHSFCKWVEDSHGLNIDWL